MNFSAIENSVLHEKKKLSDFLSRFFKNSRILIILLIAAVITAVSVSIWIKSPDYQILYNNLSDEDSGTIINELNQMKIPYQLTDISGQISVPKNKVYEIRLHLAENNLPKSGGIGFELLDKAKFGVSQFNEKINYQRALEGELARTIKRINIVKNARIHIAFPESSLFLHNKKPSSASVVLELQSGYQLDSGQINAILHLVSSSISNLPIDNITIVDQLGTLLNQTSLEKNQVNNFKLKYSEDIESRYSNRIKNILEPLVGIGNVYAQVTAQVDFNSQEKTQEQYSPNTNHQNQAIRSHQISIHDQRKQDIKENIPNSFSNSNQDLYSNKNKTYNKKELDLKKQINHSNNNKYTPVNTNINHDHTINYELNHSVLHTKMNVGEIKRLSAAVIINFIKDRNGKIIPLNKEKIKNIEKLTCEAIGYSKSRGDSVHIVNASFFKNNKILPIKINHDERNFELSNFLFNVTPWFLSFMFLFSLLKKYIFPISKKNNFKNIDITEKKKKDIKNENNLENDTFQLHMQKNKNLDKLIHQICNISNQNPRTIALIIREWMSDKI
ncbi:flagellar basal body M-ring protein FliF [Buchnera aphidicola (Macrosiphoniella sanborni)]|uniref:Flagellar M-ring protein n=1 Tax=Buchnera aphidicola (Macrosiphoniella sanborni) TaxID=1241865 RepID=A0A4D6YDB2_9GAMM|nr:flagellar basal-body MS-ring/collar protein FliF [Buchnera aphidicola]QCI23640.1 flagellar basal body M-ring protein FliF [Buchnera aphidicola (Macrosiphoniella sanborni)]